jgi:hypothetical protein
MKLLLEKEDAENSPKRRGFLPPNHRYRDLSGDCYVHGIMYGEALKHDDFHIEDFLMK